MPATESILGNIESAVTILAIVGGAIWAYFKFVQGRLFHAKVEVELDGVFAAARGQDVIVASLRVRNVGFTRMVLETDGCAMQVFTNQTRPDLDFTDSALWHLEATVPILGDHDWIEPGEMVQEKEVIQVHSPVDLAVRLVANVSDGHSLWKASTIVAKS